MDVMITLGVSVVCCMLRLFNACRQFLIEQQVIRSDRTMRHCDLVNMTSCYSLIL